MSEKARQIADLNDRFRRRFGVACSEQRLTVPGQIVTTRGVARLVPDIQARVWNAVIEFDGFSEDNDPNDEHDFGAFKIEGVGKMFWRFDYYADASCKSGSEDPSDITRCYRVMTIMRAQEYWS